LSSRETDLYGQRQIVWLASWSAVSMCTALEVFGGFVDGSHIAMAQLVVRIYYAGSIAPHNGIVTALRS
jgi:hypothetical protein